MASSTGYLALYRKYRPQTFDDVRGRDAIVRTLKNQIITNRISHSYLFCGTRGTGKTTIAKILRRLSTVRIRTTEIRAESVRCAGRLWTTRVLT